MTKFWSCPEETRRSAVQIRTTPPNILNVLIQMEADATGKVTIENTRKHVLQNRNKRSTQKYKQPSFSICNNQSFRYVTLAYARAPTHKNSKQQLARAFHIRIKLYSGARFFTLLISSPEFSLPTFLFVRPFLSGKHS